MENLKSPAPPADSLAASPDQAAPSSGENSFAEILSEFEQHHHGPARGQATQGTVVSITSDAIFVDIGRKIDGILPTQLFRDEAGQLFIHVGDKVLVTITGSDGEGSYTLSTIKVERPKDWSALEKAFAENRAIAGRVTEVVKGGLRVDVGVPAFLPASRSGAKEPADLEKLVGQDIQCKIIKLDTSDEDVVVDRRAVLEEEEKLSRQKRLAELVEGVTVRGSVRSVTDFGAFVDLGGGLDGLLHVTDMAWHRVAKPSDFVNPGDSVEVKILKISPETRRISLGMKQLTPDPWTLASESFQVSQRVHGKVSRLTDFGAFIELAPGLDGLIHVSEMSWAKKIKRPADVLKLGESVEVVVLGVNAAERRIALGLKQALGDPWEEAARKYPPGTIVEGPVSSLTNFGCFVSLGDGVEGMIHISDITREKRLNHPREALTAGQQVRAVVLELDQERRRIKLGIKQLEPTTADEYIGEHQAGETVTGRIVEAGRGQAKVELGEGVFAECRLPERATEAPAAAPQPDRVSDLSSLTAMLSAKWKQGSSTVKSEGPEPVRAGQIRSFRILKLDQAGKKIEVELAS
jgi:small subunit ribosomal protein S1